MKSNAQMAMNAKNSLIGDDKNFAHLRLKSGEAQRIVTAGTTGGMRRIASLIWFFHKLMNVSRWLSVSGFLAGAELRSREARLSLTGLSDEKWKVDYAIVNC